MFLMLLVSPGIRAARAKIARLAEVSVPRLLALFSYRPLTPSDLLKADKNKLTVRDLFINTHHLDA